MKAFCTFLLCLVVSVTIHAQRQMETLDRGLVAISTSSGVFLSWRILGEEYYDTKYNVYRDGSLVNESPLSVSNYTDASGSTSSTYTVKAVVNEVEGTACSAVSVWSDQYLSVAMEDVYSRNGTKMNSSYELNDVSAADLDGDGEFELIVKRINADDTNDLFPVDNDSAYCIFEAYKLDGTKLWTIDCGPNLISSGHVETNIVAFDWDLDGKAELIMRAADGTILGDNTVVGDGTLNYRSYITHTSNMTYATTGDEFLVYMEGETAAPYQILEYPLKRFEDGETDLSTAWGDGYGHRSNKFFFGAPYLDGVNPSLFLARGIYTRHKMIAYDIDASTHELSVRWEWVNSTSSSPWYGQGYHNFGIADVDLDGRDEIVYGSMVIDDNGYGLHTCGLGHGDAQHTGNLNPFHKGLEIYTCNEDNPGSTYRDGTTGKIYYRYSDTNDVGRCMAANVSDDYFGSEMIDARSGLVISSVTGKSVQEGYTGMTMNNNIYWDGDLLSETFDYASCSNNLGVNGTVYKFGESTGIFVASGTYTNNGTKGNPSLQCDILGDWREELIVRSTDNMSLRIYTTTDETPWRNYTLLHDMQYRQAICWQMCGYNQPPHVSYFLGESEGITIAPPPVMTNGRTIIDSEITSSHNDLHILLCNTEGGTVTVTDGVTPYITTVNVPSHTQGSAPSEATADEYDITTTYSEYTLTGGVFSGTMRLVKQGEGILNFSGDQLYTGDTDLWGGTTNFSGSLVSTVNMMHFSNFNASGTFSKGIHQQYGSVLSVGGSDNLQTLSVDTLTLNFGATVEFDIYSDDFTADFITVNSLLTLGTLSVDNGPDLTSPVFSFVRHDAEDESTVSAGEYPLMLIDSDKIDGDISDISIDGLQGLKTELTQRNDTIYLVVYSLRDATDVTWTGTVNSDWDLATTANFINSEGEEDVFVNGDIVYINDDDAVSTTLTVTEEILPSEIIITNETTDFTIEGEYGITGTGSITKSGAGTLTINNDNNSFTGGVSIEGGSLVASSMPNETSENSAIGAYASGETILSLSNSSVLTTSAAVQMGSNIQIGSSNDDQATINTDYTFTMDGLLLGNTLVKSGSGTLAISGANTITKTIIEGGTISITNSSDDTYNGYLGEEVVLKDGTLTTCNNGYVYSSAAWNVNVPEGYSGTWNGDCRCEFSGDVTGAGELTVYAPSSSGSIPRCIFTGDWSAFTGTIYASTDGGDFQFSNSNGLPYATLDLSSGCTFTAYKAQNSTSYACQIAQVVGEGVLGTASSWTIGADTDFTFDGTFDTSASFTKVGSCTMTISGDNTISGTITISEGTIYLKKVGRSTRKLLGSGKLVINSGAKLVGAGNLYNRPTNLYGTLQPGYPGALTSNGCELCFNEKNLKVYEGSEMIFEIESASLYGKITDIATLSIEEACTITVTIDDSYSPSDGDTFQLWEAATNTVDSTMLTLSLPTLPDGYEWDTTEITSGVLSIKSTTAIRVINYSEPLECEVYNLLGMKVAIFSAYNNDIQQTINELSLEKGIYIVKAGNNGKTISRKYIKL